MGRNVALMPESDQLLPEGLAWEWGMTLTLMPLQASTNKCTLNPSHGGVPPHNYPPLTSSRVHECA